MDLNELLHAHQVAVMKACAVGDGDTRQGHFDKVAEYAERIGQLRAMRRNTGPPPLPNALESVIYASYAGDTLPRPAAKAIASWEGEGGALNPPEIPLPAGLTMKTFRRYYVGSYVYEDLELALAEHGRQKADAGGAFQARRRTSPRIG
ncbi:MAG: hypothetical protein WC692_00030 [Erythrobacter sp.]|jgi:hypothetical protein